MDFSSSYYYLEDEKWVGFCPSNINRLHMSSCSHSSDQLCIFNNAPGGGVINGGEEDAGRGATDLSKITCGSPTLEDFLGGCPNSCSSATAATDVSQFGDGRQTNLYDQHDLYDSDQHKTINAAVFLPDFSAQQTQTPKQLTVVPPPFKKAVDSYGHRTSIYRGVTRHRWTGRYEAHLWDNTCRREGQSRKGRQVYLGGYDKEEKAARAYDLASLKYWGPTTTTNFPVCNYVKELEDMKNMTRQEFVAALRRKSSGFSRGASIYRGVTRHHQHGRWQARIGRVAGNKDLYLGTFSTQEEAAEAYDIAAIKFRGLNAVTNFDMSRYDVKSIASSNLPVGGKSSKTSPDDQSAGNFNNKTTDGGSGSDGRDLSMSSSITFALEPLKQDPSEYLPMLGYNQQNSCSSTSTQNLGYNTTSGLFQGTTPFSVEFSTLIETNNNNVGLLCGGGGNHIQQQQTSSIPFTTPISLNSHDKSNYYGGGGFGNFGNWIAAPSLQHSVQTVKANLPGVFQSRPILGTE